ncbi:MAG: M28 family peptidase [Gemmatimonadaceae bacterium]
MRRSTLHPRAAALTAALSAAVLSLPATVCAQAASAAPPSAVDPRIFDIVAAASPDRIEADIRTLVSFGTRNTFSDTLSETRGIGAARRWIKDELDRISAECGGCLEVYFQGHLQTSENNPARTYVVNVIAVQRGSIHPNRRIIMSGDIDSRVSSSRDSTSDSPGANDNASGIAGVLEAARLLSEYDFGSTVIYAALSGEEQGLWGGRHMAEVAKQEGWEIIGVLNNDMIGNIEGVDGVIDNTSFRVFSEGTPVGLTEQQRRSIRFYGGEFDGPSRQLARYVDRITELYFTNLDAMMIYRLDRFGRGGHHRPFNDLGFPGVRIMETHENYNRQHQDLRTENGIEYGDVIEGVNVAYAARLAAANAATMAALAWAPPAPDSVLIGGAVSASTTLSWQTVDDPGLAGYRVYWRATTAPQWEESRFVGTATSHTLENIVIDNYLFGVAAVGTNGNESVVAFPSGLMRR